MSQKNLKHIAIILDGNRRFAKKLMLEPWKGHEYGKEKVESLVDWCFDLGIKELTLYTFSIQNFNRPKTEFDYLMKLINDAFKEFLKSPKVKKYGLRVNIIGRYKMFSKDIVEVLEEVMAKTKNNSGLILNFALAYGGREEMIDAIKKLVSEGLPAEKITEKVIGKHLYLNSDPDIIIRTGGEHRTSNFLLWQSNYSEWFFIDKHWPEFEKKDLVNILEEYKTRERRFGR